ncbi:MAG: DNA polymerase III subunit chi [Gammaproteobacteria bacterium]|nr:DNA polymerase III subunit chi [Gammaproteobacteria bacterium]
MSQQPRVSFYPLSQVGSDAALYFACRLTEKACQLGHRVHLHTTSIEQARLLDTLLWQFKPESFLPHVLLESDPPADSDQPTITIGTGKAKPDRPEVLINLADVVWDYHTEFKDIREIVTADETHRVLGRERYRRYQQWGYPVETLKI